MFKFLNRSELDVIEKNIDLLLKAKNLLNWRKSNDFIKFENFEYSEEKFIFKINSILSIPTELAIDILGRNIIKTINEYYKNLKEIVDIASNTKIDIEKYIHTFNITDLVQKFSCDEYKDLDAVVFEKNSGQYGLARFEELNKGFTYYKNKYSEDEYEYMVDDIWGEVPMLYDVESFLLKLFEIFEIDCKIAYCSCLGTKQFYQSNIYQYFKDEHETTIKNNDYCLDEEGFLDEDWFFQTGSESDSILVKTNFKIDTDLKKQMLECINQELPEENSWYYYYEESDIWSDDDGYLNMAISESTAQSGISKRISNLFIALFELGRGRANGKS